MLNPCQAPLYSHEDLVLFDFLDPYDHWTRRAGVRVDFVGLRDSIASHFKSDGRPAVEPILCLKLELIMFHDGLPDRQVFAKAKTDIAYRKFLGPGRDEHLQDIVEWVTKLSVPEDAESNAAWQALKKSIEIAHKVLHGQDEPNAPHKLRSTVDEDVRRGKHGSYYDGYSVDVLIDADSEFFTSINLLPATVECWSVYDGRL